MGVDERNLRDIAERHGLSFVALFGSSTRGQAGRDLDVAVMPISPLDDLTDRNRLFQELSDALGPVPVDLSVLPNASWLLNWQVARDGVCLLGQAAFERFCESALWRKIDSGWWRGAEREFLAQFLRKENGMDKELIQRRLVQMAQYLGELEMVLKHPQEEFSANPLLLRTAERDTELLVECAAKINTAIGQSKGIPPSDYYSSFFALTPDWLAREVAEELAKLARLRNMLIHQYEDVRPEQVYQASLRSAPLWRSYLQSILSKLG